MIRFPHVREQDACAGLLPSEVPDRRRDRPAEDIVREHDHETFPGGEVARQAECLGDAAGLFLLAVRELVSEQAAEVVDVLAPGHEHQLRDVGFAQGVDRVDDHRPVVDG